MASLLRFAPFAGLKDCNRKKKFQVAKNLLIDGFGGDVGNTTDRSLKLEKREGQEGSERPVE